MHDDHLAIIFLLAGPSEWCQVPCTDTDHAQQCLLHAFIANFIGTRPTPAPACALLTSAIPAEQKLPKMNEENEEHIGVNGLEWRFLN